MTELWKSVEGYEGVYDVSSFGRIRRLYDGGADGWRILKLSLNKTGTGYFHVSLSKDGAIRRNAFVHHLVAIAFLGPRGEGMLACHNDGNSLNNKVENLRYDTMSANQHDRAKHGTSNHGERHGKCKLSDEDVKMIRATYQRGKGKEIAKMLGVAPHTVTRIAAGGSRKGAA